MTPGVRALPGGLSLQLRLQVARHGRSMEEEAALGGVDLELPVCGSIAEAAGFGRDQA